MIAAKEILYLVTFISQIGERLFTSHRVAVRPSTSTLLFKSLNRCISKEGWGGLRHVSSPPRHMTHASVTHATTSYRWQTTRRSPFSHPSPCWRTEGPVGWWGHRKRIPAPNWTPSHILRGEERPITVRHVITQCYVLYFEVIVKRVFCWFCISVDTCRQILMYKTGGVFLSGTCFSHGPFCLRQRRRCFVRCVLDATPLMALTFKGTLSPTLVQCFYVCILHTHTQVDKHKVAWYTFLPTVSCFSTEWQVATVAGQQTSQCASIAREEEEDM